MNREQSATVKRIAALASVVLVVAGVAFVAIPKPAKGQEAIAIPGIVSITTPSPMEDCAERLAEFEKTYKLPMRELLNVDNFIQVSFEMESGSITVTCQGDTLTIDIVSEK